MGAERSWEHGSVWTDQRVDGDRLLLVREPGTLEGRASVVRATTTRRRSLARVEQSDLGTEAHVHDALARRLGESGPKFQAEWRLAHRYDLLRHVDRATLVAAVATVVAVVVAAVIAFENDHAKLGGLATAGLVVAIVVGLIKLRSEWRKLLP